jgi:hypothetical protein
MSNSVVATTQKQPSLGLVSKLLPAGSRVFDYLRTIVTRQSSI